MTFDLIVDNNGTPAILTDDPVLADMICKKNPDLQLWFVAGPTREVAQSIADGMQDRFPGNWRAVKNTRDGMPSWSVVQFKA